MDRNSVEVILHENGYDDFTWISGSDKGGFIERRASPNGSWARLSLGGCYFFFLFLNSAG